MRWRWRRTASKRREAGREGEEEGQLGSAVVAFEEEETYVLLGICSCTWREEGEGDEGEGQEADD